MKKVIGVDLGGTNMRAARVNGSEIIEHTARAVPKTNVAEEVTSALVKTIGKVMDSGVEGIGIGVPGLVKSDEGIVFDIQNIPSWKNIRLKEILENEFQVPVYINNDANCFAVGERVFGKGKKYSDFVGLITGTGLGAGIIKNGKLLPDQNCGAGEFGMIPYLHGVYEDFCSGQFFENEYNTEGGNMAREAQSGNKNAIEAFNAYGKHLGTAIKTILFTVDPKAIVLGGSVSKSFKLYEQALWDEVKTFPYRYVTNNLEIVTTDVKEIAILGAAALYINMAG